MQYAQRARAGTVIHEAGWFAEEAHINTDRERAVLTQVAMLLDSSHSLQRVLWQTAGRKIENYYIGASVNVLLERAITHLFVGLLL